MQSLFDHLGGMPGIREIALAWHELVLADDVLSHAFSRGFAHDHIDRLTAYWAEVFGGPQNYSARYGTESDVVRMHSGNGSHTDMTNRAVRYFEQAVASCGWPIDEPVGEALCTYFAWAATSQINKYPTSADDVPHGLEIPRW